VLGPLFDTPLKQTFGAPIGLAELERARTRCRIPIFGIGGITTQRVRDARQAGAHGVAVISAVMAAHDVEAICREFLEALNE
jgi:thiamine-phosphate pyrophosphorylase